MVKLSLAVVLCAAAVACSARRAPAQDKPAAKAAAG
jgi:hypothetical protein